MKRLSLIISVLALALPVQAQHRWDRTVWDFGDVSVTDGPLSCTFTLVNEGKEDMYIYEVVSSCGCTGVEWTKSAIKNGGKGVVKATYKNEDGPGAFDKQLTVYLTGEKRPVKLRLRGVVHERAMTLEELFGPSKIGPLGLKSRELKTGNILQGGSAGDEARIANLSSAPMMLSFIAPDNLSLKVEPNPVPAGETAVLKYSVHSVSGVYGRNSYTVLPVINGENASERFEVVAVTRENFAHLSKEERDNAPVVSLSTGTFEFGKVKAGKAVSGSISISNRGKRSLKIYRADSESPALTLTAPEETAPGKSGEITFNLDTAALPKGENVIMISLYTNAPLRPVVNIFVAGVVL